MNNSIIIIKIIILINNNNKNRIAADVKQDHNSLSKRDSKGRLQHKNSREHVMLD